MAVRMSTKVLRILEAPPYLRLALWNQKGIAQIRDLAILKAKLKLNHPPQLIQRRYQQYAQQNSIHSFNSTLRY